jgi:hypothetical protein
MRTILAVLAAAAATLLLAAPAMSGVSGPAFYFDGTLYRTVGTPTDLTGTGAPAHSFDVIYEFFGVQQYNVTTVAPGSEGYNGGRWTVMGLAFADYDAAVAAYDLNDSGDFDSAAEVEAAITGGAASVFDTGVRFVCPVIKVPKGS